MKSSTPPSHPVHSPRVAVLLVDDDADFRGLVRVAVEEAAAALVPPVDVEVSEVCDGEAAVGFLRRSRRRPALVLMDVEMPGGDGLSALRAVKSCPDLRDVPTVMLSGRDDDAIVRAAAALGANGYVVKPRDADALFDVAAACVGFWLRAHRAARARPASAESTAALAAA